MIMRALNTLRAITIINIRPPLTRFYPLFTFTTSEAVEKKEERKGVQRRKKMFGGEQGELTLTRLIRHYRTKMQSTKNQLSQLCHHSKKIAGHYKKQNHQEFVQQKDQLIDILHKVHKIDCQHLQLKQYFNLLDFIRICDNVESVNFSTTYRQARDKVFSLFELFKKKIQVGTLVDLSILYCKLAPIGHPSTFTVSGLLHDKMAEEVSQSKKLGLSTMQVYVLLRSMGKRNFLSFPDKKILQMLLMDLKGRRLTDMVTPFAVALRDLNVEVNLSDYRYYSISEGIQAKALSITEKGQLQPQNIEYLQTINKSQSPYFVKIFLHLTKQYISSFSTCLDLSLPQFKEFVAFVKQLPSTYSFEHEEKKIVVKYCEQLYLKQGDQAGRKALDFELLELIRSDFFGNDLPLIDNLFHDKGATFIWSFPLQYSLRNVRFHKFPLSILEQTITKMPKLRLDGNTLKLWVTLPIQSNFHPQNEILKQSTNSLIEVVKTYQWKLQDLTALTKLSAFYPELVQQFHNLYHQYYLHKLVPSREEMAKDRQIKKGERSSILSFWEYLLVQQHISHEMVSKMPVYAVYLTCHRECKGKNKEKHPKAALLLAIDHMLSTKKIKLLDQESIKIIDLLVSYCQQLNPNNQYVIELYYNCVMHLIAQYQTVSKTSLPYLHFLLAQLLTSANTKTKHSLHYKNMLVELIRLIESSTISQNYSYLRTTIVRQGLRNNSISDIHLSYIDIHHFKEHEQRMIYAIYGKYEAKDMSTEEILLAVKLDGKGLGENYQAASQIIDANTLEELGSYLTHYSFVQKTNENILNNICQQFINKLNSAAITPTSLDLMPILRNIIELSSKMPTLYKELMGSICRYLSAHPESTMLIDHCQIIDLLRDNNIDERSYVRSLWEYCRQQKGKGSSFIDLMIKAKASAQEGTLYFSKEDFELAYEIALVTPQKFIRLIVEQQGRVEDIDNKLKKLADYVGRPLPSSLHIAYLEHKYNTLFSKSRSASRTTSLVSKFIKLMEENEIRLKQEMNTGEPIYRITSKTILFFNEKANSNEAVIVQKMIKSIYQQNEIVQLPANPNVKDLTYALSQLHILQKQMFTTEVLQRIQSELQTA